MRSEKGAKKKKGYMGTKKKRKKRKIEPWHGMLHVFTFSNKFCIYYKVKTLFIANP